MRASLARVFIVALFLLPLSFANAAVETYREGVSGYSSTQDTYVQEDTPGSAHGNEAFVVADLDGDGIEQGLIRFDNIFGGGVGQIPLGSIINSATLTVDVYDISDCRD